MRWPCTCSSLLFPPNKMGWDWACRSAARSSRRTAASFTANRSRREGRFFGSLSQLRRSWEKTMTGERTVHVVDDDAAVRRSLERLLDAAGFHVVSYQSPAAFLGAAPGLSAGCVLLDIRMPGVDGLEVQARLNRLRVNLSVIVMTGHG